MKVASQEPMRLLRRLTFSGLLAMLPGCTDTTAPEASGLRFQYSGVESGIFQASGTPVSNTPATLVRGSFASAIPDVNGTFKVISNDTAGMPFGNMLNMWGVPARTGTYSIASILPGVVNAGVAFHLGVQWTPSAFSSDRLYVMRSGTVTVAEYGPFRVRGTFEGTALRFTTVSGEAPREVMITGGAFDAPLSDIAAAQVRCVLFSC